MKAIKIDLPREHKYAEIHIFADEHIGDEFSDLDSLKKRIEYVRDTPNAYCFLNGDILDNAVIDSVGDTYSQVFSPLKQLELAVELFAPIAHKILLITHGNHENRTYKKSGINLSQLIATQLGLSDRYTPTSAVLFIRLGQGGHHTRGRKVSYTLFALHGSGGGKEGSIATRLANMAAIVDCDIYCHAHSHLPMIYRLGFHRIDTSNSSVAPIEKLFVNSAANLRYGGYAEAAEFKPPSRKSPVIYLSGERKEFEARL